MNGSLVVSAEFFYPTYKTFNNSNGDPAFNGYQYTHAVVLGFNVSGEKEFEHCIPIHLGYKALRVNQKLARYMVDGAVKLGYFSSDKVYSFSLKDGKIDLSAGQLFIMPNQTKEGFLAINYQEPKLSEALRGVRSLFHKEPNYLNFIDSIATGKAKDEYLTFRENIGLKPRPSINDQISVGVTDVDEVKLQFENGARPAPQNADVFGREKVKIGSQEESNKKETEQTRKPSSLPWIIAGVLLVGILFLLLRNFKGKSTS